MTIEEAIRILDPETTAEALAEVEYYGGFRGNEALVKVCEDACIVAVDALKRTRWIPCSERLPEDGQDVLCWYQYFRYGNYNRLWQTYGIGFQYNGHWGGEVSTGRDTKVLFWMPLPEPPGEVQENE